jgi:hypothetical protein
VQSGGRRPDGGHVYLLCRLCLRDSYINPELPRKVQGPSRTQAFWRNRGTNNLSFQNLIPLKMAVVNFDNVQFYYKPPFKPSTQKPRNALPHDNFRVAFVTSSGNQPAQLHNIADPAFKRDRHSKWPIEIARRQGHRQGHDLALQHEDDAAGAQGRVRECFRNELF